jgi:hypothetical protein
MGTFSSYYTITRQNFQTRTYNPVKKNISSNRLQTNIADHRITFKNHFETPGKVLQNLWHRANLIF